MRDFVDLVVDGLLEPDTAVLMPLSGNLRTASDRNLPLLSVDPFVIAGTDVARGNKEFRALGLGVRTIAVVATEEPAQGDSLHGSVVFVVDGWRALAEAGKTDLSHLDLRGAALAHADLRGADLQSADLRGADLSRANLSCADLRGADLRGASGYGIDLSHCDLRGADLRRTDLRNGNLRGCVVAGSSWAGADLWAAVASQGDFEDAFISEAELERCDLRGDRS